jgi:flagellar biosynthetic protein FliO
MTSGPTDPPGRSPAGWLPTLLNRLPPRWRMPALWTGAAVVLALAGWLLPSAMSGAGDPGSPTGGPLEIVSLVASVVLKLGLVLLLVYGCLWLLRRWQGAAGRAQERRLSLLESLRLSPKQALHVVRAGDQVLLIGATDQALTVLAQLPPAPAAAAEAAPVESGFSQLLNRFQGSESLELGATRGQHVH